MSYDELMLQYMSIQCNQFLVNFSLTFLDSINHNLL